VSHADDTPLEEEGRLSPALTYNDESMKSCAAHNASHLGVWGRERSGSCVAMSLDSNTDLEAIESVAGVWGRERSGSCIAMSLDSNTDLEAIESVAVACSLNASTAYSVRTDTVDIVVEQTGEETGAEKRITCECPWIWFVGSFVFAIGNGCDFVALGIAPQSVVTLVGSWCLVVNTMTAQYVLSEVTTRYDVLSSLVIICGIVLTVLPCRVTCIHLTHVVSPSSRTLWQLFFHSSRLCTTVATAYAPK